MRGVKFCGLTRSCTTTVIGSRVRLQQQKLSTTIQQSRFNISSITSAKQIQILSIPSRSFQILASQSLFSHEKAANTDSKASLHWGALALAGGLCSAMTLSQDNTYAVSFGNESNKNDKDEVIEKVKKFFNEFSQQYGPDNADRIKSSVEDVASSGIGGQITIGFAMGLCSGYAARKVSKLGALAVGLLFIMFQSASYAGYINVNYSKLEMDLKKLLDYNKDGKVDIQDANDFMETVIKVLEFGLPSGSGFAAGFYLGFRRG